DGTRLFVAAPSRLTAGSGTVRTEPNPKSSILDIAIDPAADATSPTKWVALKSLEADDGTADVRATLNPNVMLFTNFLSDGSGLGVITDAKGARNPTPYSVLFKSAKESNPFAVHNALSVAITPDGNYAFVAGFNTPNELVPSKNHFVPGYDPA